MRNAFIALGLGWLLMLSMPLLAQTSNPSALQKQARISKQEAAKTALAKVPNGTIKEGELEKENGKLVWSFDISRPNTTATTEVQVDSRTGKIVSVKQESAAAEAAEKKGETPHKKK